MDLSNDLISKFVKITNDGDKKESKEGTVYGITVEYDGSMYVKIDGSDLLTPIDTTADIKEGERVTIMIKDHNATVTGNITSPSASSNDVKKVTKDVESIGGEIAEFNTIIADVVHTGELDAEIARIDELIADKASIENLTATNAEITNLKAKDAQIENLVAEKADITYLDAKFATVDQLEATHADIEVLDAEVATINTLVSGNLTSDNILSFHVTADKVTMDDAFISDAMIANVTAGKITSGSINTNLVSVQSEDGALMINGSTQQFKDADGNVRIQIGKDATGDFTFALYGKDGQGQLINQNGITSSAITDGLIVDKMVADNAAISGGKLDISSVITEINGDNSTTIKSNKIHLNEQNQSLEVAFNSLKTQVETIQNVTIDGDLTSVIEQVQSNTTEIEVCKEGISTLVAEDTVIKEQVTDLNGNIVEVNKTLSAKYAAMEQNVDGFKTEVANTYTTKGEFNNMEIGGTNLVRNSTFVQGEQYWTLDSGCSISTISTPYPSVLSEQTGHTAHKWYGCRSFYIPDTGTTIKKGETYTISAYYFVSAKNIPDYGIGVCVKGYNPNGEFVQIDGVLVEKLEPTNWFRMHKTFTATQDYTQCLAFAYVRRNGTAWFNRIQLEKGNKITEWNLSAIDLQTQIDDTNNNLKTNYSTTKAMTSAIEQSATSIASSVSSTYTTKVEFNGLNIGGRNLAKLSDTAASNKNYMVAEYGMSELFKGSEKYTITVCVTPASGVTSVAVFTSGGYHILATLNTSGTSKQTISKTINMSSYYYSDRVPSNVDDIHAKLQIYRYPNDGTVTGTTTIHWVKVEKGDKATDWTPAPEDVQNGIDTASSTANSALSKANTNASSISSLSTRVTNAEQKITTDAIVSTVTESSSWKTQAANISTAQSTANTAKTNAATAQSTANTANTTANSALGKANTNASNISSLTTRVSTAESKLTKNSLTTTIGSYYTTSSDVNGLITAKGYATTSEVKQTSESLTATFKASGGYNLIYNGGFKRDFTKWTNNGAVMSYALTCPRTQTGIRITGALNTTKHCMQYISLDTKQPITVSFWQYTSASGTNGSTNPYRQAQITATYTDDTREYWSTKSQSTFDTWELISYTINPSKRLKGLHIEFWNRDTTKNVYYANAMVEYGTVATEWTPNPNEVHAGVTVIDNDGVRVNQSNYNGFTQMSASGFYVNNGSENVISATSSGLKVKGNITATSGKIANFTISGNDLIGSSVGMGGASGTNQAFWAGSNTSTSAPFRVAHDGSLVATKATITGTINGTAGTFSGNITTDKIMKAYGSVYVGTEIWGGFTSTDGSYVSNSPLTLKATTTLNIEAGNIYLKPTSEVVCGTSSAYKNLRAREIYAQEIVYTNDIRVRNSGSIGMSNITMASGNGFIEFSSGYGVIRVPDVNHLYLQTGGGAANTSSEVRCTAYKTTNVYVNLRAHNVCAQNAVYANGVNVTSDINRKRDIELYKTDALHEICTTPVYAYHLDTDLDEEIKRIGIVMQEAPLDAIDLSGKGVDLYQMVTMLWKATQQQQEMIDELKQQLKGE